MFRKWVSLSKRLKFKIWLFQHKTFLFVISRYSWSLLSGLSSSSLVGRGSRGLCFATQHKPPPPSHIQRLRSECLFCLVVLLPCCIAAQCSALVGSLATRRPKPWVTPPHGDTSHRDHLGWTLTWAMQKCALLSYRLRPAAPPFTLHIRSVDYFLKTALSLIDALPPLVRGVATHFSCRDEI